MTEPVRQSPEELTPAQRELLSREPGQGPAATVRPPGDEAPEAGLRAALDMALGVIELGDQRAMAADGPVGHLRDELSDVEWRRLYVALSKARAALAAKPDREEPLDVERLARALAFAHPGSRPWPSRLTSDEFARVVAREYDRLGREEPADG